MATELQRGINDDITNWGRKQMGGHTLSFVLIEFARVLKSPNEDTE